MTQQEREKERHRQAVTLEVVVGAASALPRRAPSPEMAFPPFRTLVRT